MQNYNYYPVYSAYLTIPFLLSLNHFSITMAKREILAWKKHHDIFLAREILVEVPHQFKAGTKGEEENGRK